LFTYGITLDSLIVVYILYVIVVIHLEKVLCQDLKCLCSKSTMVILE